MSEIVVSAITGITGLILAGGLARRRGGGDKGLRPFRGEALVTHAVARLAPQVEALIISANQNLLAYEAFGYPVVADTFPGYAGPLAGLHAGLSACTTPLLVTVPCDSPLLPLDLVVRLHAALTGAGAQLAVAQAGGRAQPVFALYRRDLLEHLTRYLSHGGRKIEAWHAALDVAGVPFDDEAAFANINTPEELERLEST